MTSHCIDIERAVELALVGMNDPDDKELEKARDDLLAVIYCWRDEQGKESPYSMADIRRMRDEDLDGNERGPLPKRTDSLDEIADWLAANRKYGSSLQCAVLLVQHLRDLGWASP